MELRPEIEVDNSVLRAFAQRHAIRRIAVFGSVLRSDFGPTSDIDLLVEFEPGRVPGLLGVASMEIELGELLGRVASRRAVDETTETASSRSTPRAKYNPSVHGVLTPEA